MKLYVGNLSYDTSEEDLRKSFEEFGTVESVTVVTDRYSGQSKGFAFVEMGSREEAQAAMSGLNRKELGGRLIKVDEARSKPQRRGSTGDGGGYGGRRDRW